MRPRTQTTRTNHLGYDVGSSRKIPDGALARVATTECLKANKTNALTRLALTLFHLPCIGFGLVKAALKSTAAAITPRRPHPGGHAPARRARPVRRWGGPGAAGPARRGGWAGVFPRLGPPEPPPGGADRPGGALLDLSEALRAQRHSPARRTRPDHSLGCPAARPVHPLSYRWPEERGHPPLTAEDDA